MFFAGMPVPAPAGEYEEMAGEKPQLFQIQREPGFVMARDLQAEVPRMAQETSGVPEALQGGASRQAQNVYEELHEGIQEEQRTYERRGNSEG